MSYYEVVFGGARNRYNRVYKGKRKQVSKDVVERAMQRGGGAMYDLNPDRNTILMWKGPMWSPADIGKADCGTPTYYEVPPDQSIPEITQSVVTAAASGKAPTPSGPSSTEPKKGFQIKFRETVEKGKKAVSGWLGTSSDRVLSNVADLLAKDSKTGKLVNDIRAFNNRKDNKVKLGRFNLNTSENPNRLDQYSKLPSTLLSKIEQVERTGAEKWKQQLQSIGMNPGNPCITDAIFAAINKDYLLPPPDTNDEKIKKYLPTKLQNASNFRKAILELITTEDTKNEYPVVKIIDSLSGTKTPSKAETVKQTLCAPPIGQVMVYLGFLSALLGINILLLDESQTVPCSIGFINPSNQYIILLKRTTGQKETYELVVRLFGAGATETTTLDKNKPAMIKFDASDTLIQGLMNKLARQTCNDNTFDFTAQKNLGLKFGGGKPFLSNKDIMYAGNNDDETTTDDDEFDGGSKKKEPKAPVRRTSVKKKKSPKRRRKEIEETEVIISDDSDY
jgi:hypothetical protein